MVRCASHRKNKRTFPACALIVVILLSALAVPAAIPLQVNHQGRVTVAGTIFNGNADFRFALVNPTTGNNVWTNDGTQVGTSSAPVMPVNLPVINGIFNVRLGDTGLANMTSIPSTVFDAPSISLRVWFDDKAGHGIVQLSPDQALASAPYAHHAAQADYATEAGHATSATLAQNAVAATNASNAADSDLLDGRDATEFVWADSLPYNLLENGSLERWPVVAGAVPEKWTNAGYCSVTKETANAKLGTASVKIVSTQNTYLGQPTLTDTTAIRGKTFTLAAWVYCGAPNTARLAIDDGISVTNSAFHSGTPGWERLTVTAVGSPSATRLEARLALAWAQTAYFDGAVLVEGALPREWAPRLLDENMASVDDLKSAALAGEVRMWAGSIATVPAGWLPCDGSAVSRAQYPRLFAAIGTIHGAGDGSTTFNLPDWRDRSPMGARQDDAGAAKTNVSGALTLSGGESTHALTEAEMPSHAHTLKDSNGVVFWKDFRAGYNGNWPLIKATITNGDPNGPYPELQSVPTGGNQPHNNLHPYFSVVYIIRY